MATGDIHIGDKLDLTNFMNDSINYIKDAIEKCKPDYFFILGDMTHKAGLKAESEEFKVLYNFILSLNTLLYSIDCKLLILQGTESHDGRNVKTAVELIQKNGLDSSSNVVYINNICTYDIGGLNFLFIPEPYFPTYQDFKDAVSLALNDTNTADVTCFHMMLDSAIPQLKHINSKYGLNRSIVVDTRYISNISKIVAFGGHFHAEKRWGNVHYLNTFTGRKGQTDSNGDIGLKVFDIDESSKQYDYTSIPNPNVDLLKPLSIDIRSLDEKDAINEIMYRINDIKRIHNVDNDSVLIILEGPCDIYSINIINNLSKVLEDKGYSVKRKLEKIGASSESTKENKLSISDDNISSILSGYVRDIYNVDMSEDIIRKHISKEE